MSSNVDSSVSDDASWKEVLFGSGASPAVACVPTVPTVPFVPIVATVPVVATTFIVPLAATVSTAPVHSGAVVKYCKPSSPLLQQQYPLDLLLSSLFPSFPIYVQTIVSSEASAEAPIEVPTEAACSAVESAFSPAVAAQAMVSVPDCDVAVSPFAPSTNLASIMPLCFIIRREGRPHGYDKPFWERSSRRKVVALPSLHMATSTTTTGSLPTTLVDRLFSNHERP
ncbi:hypothetical protein BASA61_000642 [Batrachochytrium salamandrivorans]|nr:hypothetical protein BASA61_000642 [Batrachochytrium salamandrivorans]